MAAQIYTGWGEESGELRLAQNILRNNLITKI